MAQIAALTLDMLLEAQDGDLKDQRTQLGADVKAWRARLQSEAPHVARPVQQPGRGGVRKYLTMSHISASCDAEIWDMETTVIIADRTRSVPFVASLDLDYDGLIDVVRYADNERALCTSNDPKGFELVVMNARVIRGLRERFCGERWESEDTDNQASIRNPHLKVRVIHCNFDKHAGDEDAMPSNLTQKGSASHAKVRCNRTPWLPGLPMPGGEPSEYVTYVLGTYFDEELGLRAELSRPIGFRSGRYFDFKPRVILLTGSGDASVGRSRRDQEGPTDIIDINIRRK